MNEWKKLMIEAKRAGFTPDETRGILKKIKNIKDKNIDINRDINIKGD